MSKKELHFVLSTWHWCVRVIDAMELTTRDLFFDHVHGWAVQIKWGGNAWRTPWGSMLDSYPQLPSFYVI